jgi:hypothetical protein
LIGFAFASVLGLAAIVVAQASPLPSPVPSPAPTVSATSVPTAMATAPAPTPTPLYKFVYRPTPSPVSTPMAGPNAPAINEIDLNDSSLVPPSPLHVRVLTSAAVVSVSAETFGRSIAIPQKDTGEFDFDGYIPNVPGFLRNRTFDVQFIATVTDGRNVTITLPLTLR